MKILVRCAGILLLTSSALQAQEVYLEQHQTVSIVPSAIVRLEFNAAANLLAIAAADRSVRLVNAATLEAPVQLPPQQVRITALAFTRSGQTLITGSADGNVISWRIAGLAPGIPFSPHRGGIAALAVQEENLVFTVGADKSIRITDLNSGNSVGSVSVSPLEPTAIALQPDGKIVVAGYSHNGSNYDIAVVRYNADGSLDTTFDGDGRVTTPVGSGYDYGQAIALQPDGKIVVAGISYNGSNDDFAVVRYNADGSLDTTFSGDGKVTTPVGGSADDGYAIALQPDGKILVAGLTLGTSLDIAVVRYNADGSLDTTFDGDGKVTTPVGTGADYGFAIALQPDGKFLVAGYLNNAGNYDFAVVRYNADGGLDTTFSGDGKVTTPVGTAGDYGYAIALQPDGKILVAGYSENGSDNDLAVVRYNADGSLDTTFDADGKLTTAAGGGNDNGYAIGLQPDGKIVVAGLSDNGTDYDFAVVRYTGSGSLDSCGAPTPTPTDTPTPTNTPTNTPTPTSTQPSPPVNAQVSASSDDAVRWGVNSFLLDSPNDWLDTFNTPNSSTGLRFTGVAIPNGATITAAYLTVRARFSETPTEGTTIFGEAADNPITFSTWGDYDFRVMTNAGVPWQPTEWSADTDYNSPSLTTVIQEIVDRPGWSSGNALILFLVPDGNQNLWAYSYDSSATYAPRLHVEYAAATPTPTATPTSTATATPTPTGTATPTPTATAVPTLFYFYDDTTPLQYMMYQTVPTGNRTTATNTTVNFYSDVWPAGWQVSSGSSIVCVHVSTNGSRTITFTVYGGTTQLGTQPVSVTGNGSAQCFFVITSSYTFATGERLRLVVAVPNNASISWDGVDSDSSLRVPGIVVP